MTDISLNIPQVSGGKAVVYARYSSHSQGEQSIEGQLSEAHRYADAHGYTIVHEYVDRAQSGRTDNRIAFQQMLRDTAKKQFDVIICWKVDRFGRNREEIAINKMRCRKNNVRVEYVAEKIPDTPEGVVLEAVLEGFAEYYSLQLSQNVRRGLAESAEKCQSTGGTRPLGYKVDADKHFVVDEDTAPIVRQVFAMYAKGATTPEIVRTLNAQGLRTRRGTPFSQNSLHAMLKNEKYIGVYTYNGRRIEDGVPRIIDDETFYKVQKLLKVNKRAPAKTWVKADYLLSDKLFCGKCGSPMVGESGTSHTGAKHNYYICAKKKRLRGCEKKAVRQAGIENEVLGTVRDLLEDSELLNHIIESVWAFYLDESRPTEVQAQLRCQLNQTETAIQNLLRALESGAPSMDINKRLQELDRQRDELQAAIANQELSAGFHLTKERLIYFMNGLKQGDFSDRRVQRKLIETFVNAVFVFDDKVTITFNYSGENNTVTLQQLQAADEFVHHTVCSTRSWARLCGEPNFVCLFTLVNVNKHTFNVAGSTESVRFYGEPNFCYLFILVKVSIYTGARTSTASPTSCYLFILVNVNKHTPGVIAQREVPISIVLSQKEDTLHRKVGRIFFCTDGTPAHILCAAMPRRVLQQLKHICNR